MGEVLKFPKIEDSHAEVVKLKEVSDAIDQIMLAALSENNLDVKDLAGLLAHRLGTLIRTVDSKDHVWAVCEQVLKRQAVIDP